MTIMDIEDKNANNPPKEPSNLGSAPGLSPDKIVQPLAISSLDQPSANPQMEEKADPEILQKNISNESRLKDVHVPGMSGQNSDSRTIDGVVTEKGLAEDTVNKLLHFSEMKDGIGSNSEPSVIPESQETVDLSKDESISNCNERESSESTFLTRGSMIGEETCNDIEEFEEVTIDRGIAQMRIEGNGNQSKPDDATSISDVIDVVDYMIKTVDDHLEGKITTLAGMTRTTEQISIDEESTGPITRTPQMGHVAEGMPMDVDLLPTGNSKGDERTKANDTSVGEIAKERVTDGVGMINKIEEDIDPSWKTEDFNLPPSDDEGDIALEPPPHVIVELYQRLEREKVLDLEWTCLGRRTPDQDLEAMVVEESEKEDKEEEMDQPVEEDPTEFDFDIDSVIQNKVTPRRTPGFEPKGSGSAKRRVANMDKVIGDIIRFSKINEEMEKTGDNAAPPAPADLEVTPQRPLGKFHIRRDLHQ